MRYMMLAYLDENALSEEERDQCYVRSTAVTHEFAAQGKFLDAAPLHPTASATSVRVRSGKRLVTDGPFAETREQLGGFFLIEADNLDQAIAMASRIPVAQFGTVEIRPVLELSGLPPSQRMTEEHSVAGD